jgi:CheY-like chemotaxis protein
MPETDGFEVLKWIRQQPNFIKLCVVVLTGSSHQCDANLALQLGANSVLLKPLGFANTVELSRSLGRLILTYELGVNEPMVINQ